MAVGDLGVNRGHLARDGSLVRTLEGDVHERLAAVRPLDHEALQVRGTAVGPRADEALLDGVRRRVEPPIPARIAIAAALRFRGGRIAVVAVREAVDVASLV